MGQYMLALIAASIMILSTARPLSFCDSPNPVNLTKTEYFINDDFDQPSLNRSIWNVIQSDSCYNYDFASGRAGLSTPSNVFLENGDLILHAKREVKRSPSNSARVFKHTTGGVTTKNRLTVQATKNETVTRMCIRAHMPTGEYITKPDGSVIDTAVSLWPALWTIGTEARRGYVPPRGGFNCRLGTPIGSPYEPVSTLPGDGNNGFINPDENMSVDQHEPSNFYNCNPDAGEIDLLERYGSKSEADFVYHWQNNTQSSFCKFPKEHLQRSVSYKLDFNEYHEWAFERSSDYLSLYVDSELIRSWNATDPFAPDALFLNQTAPWMVYMNLALKSAPTEDFPEEGFKVKIDYVKVVSFSLPDPPAEPEKPEEPEKEKASRGWIGAVVGGILGGVVLIALIIIGLCCACTKKDPDLLPITSSIN